MNSVTQLIQKIKTLALIAVILWSAIGFAIRPAPANPPGLVVFQPTSLPEALDHSLRHGFRAVDWQAL